MCREHGGGGGVEGLFKSTKERKDELDHLCSSVTLQTVFAISGSVGQSLPFQRAPMEKQLDVSRPAKGNTLIDDRKIILGQCLS